MSIVKCHESHYVGVLDNPHRSCKMFGVRPLIFASITGNIF